MQEIIINLTKHLSALKMLKKLISQMYPFAIGQNMFLLSSLTIILKKPYLEKKKKVGKGWQKLIQVKRN